MSEKPTPSKASEWSGDKATKFDNKAYSEYFDPCQEAADRSIRCLKRNGGERAMCADFFQHLTEHIENAKNNGKLRERKPGRTSLGLDELSKMEISV
ncbi:hypothetical protein yc1106_07115 [Curvularia clavata]|uniref:Uncharacterized protein n=1 Tax=Curvularia clavata TaxID=95742 RepID=A0A9Q8ZAZ9_CURCL|nr:hypothetical protein yc1106_07115 [Curvularia clavata]